jgi:23S rRNA (uridine2552-2'-O)-methyltransferase
MARSNSSDKWLKEHFDDQWVKKARDAGYRSRASFKLLEIHQKDKLFKPGMAVVDLGSAPGGWSQIAAKLVKPGGSVVASDILDMEPIDDVHFIRGDFTDEACFSQIMAAVGGKPVDLVISDMAPNLSGMNDIDQPRAMHLIDLAMDFADQALRPGGSLLMKVFQGEGFNELLQQLRRDYAVVLTRKPEASRARSREVYLLARDKKG